MAIPLTIETVRASPIESSVERPPRDHSQQAKISPAYWIGR